MFLSSGLCKGTIQSLSLPVSRWSLSAVCEHIPPWFSHFTDSWQVRSRYHHTTWDWTVGGDGESRQEYKTAACRASASSRDVVPPQITPLSFTWHLQTCCLLVSHSRNIVIWRQELVLFFYWKKVTARQTLIFIYLYISKHSRWVKIWIPLGCCVRFIRESEEGKKVCVWIRQ